MMKKLFLYAFLGLILSSCGSDHGLKYRKHGCQEFGYKKGSEEYKECIKSPTHYFVYGIEHEIERKKEEYEEYNKVAEKINKIKLEINEEEYEEVDFEKFLYANYDSSFSIATALPKNENIIGKKIKFKSTFNFMPPDKTIWLNKKDSYFFESEFHNIEIKNKFSFDYIHPFILVNLPSDTTMIYGNFDKDPGIYNGSGFYIRDIVLGKAIFDKEKIKKELLEDHIYSMSTGDADRPSKSEIRKIVNDLLKAKK